MPTTDIFAGIQAKVASGLGIALSNQGWKEDVLFEHLARHVAAPLEMPIYWWDSALKMKEFDPQSGALRVPETLSGWRDGLDVIEFLRTYKQPGLFVMVDAHRGVFSNSLQASAMQRELITTLKALYRTDATRLILLGQDVEPTTVFKDYLARVEIPLPDEPQRQAEIEAMIPVLRRAYPRLVVPGADDGFVWGRLRRDSATLSLGQISNIMAEVAHSSNSVGLATADTFHQQKIENLKALGIPIVSYGDEPIGGYDLLRSWFDQRARYFDGHDPHVPAPKGFVVVGHPGTGKSMMPKYAAHKLGNIPLCKLEADQLFGGIVGESEKKTKQVIRAIQAAAPLVLWIDEVDKLFAGMASGYAGDGGAGGRVFGQFLTFLQENTAPIFVIATANRIDVLPSEFKRSGRFDGVFFADNPNELERQEILQIHLSQWGRLNAPDSLTQLAETLSISTEGYSGSDLAQIVKEAAYAAADAGRSGQLDLGDLQRLKSDLTPQSTSEAAQYAQRREQCQNLRPASRPYQRQAEVITTGRSLRRRTPKTDDI